MPRFSDQEREFIQDALLEEGEKLFSLYGLKKVVVDDIAEAANISKGSFYNFYKNKEHLYAVIVFRVQERLFKEIHKELGKKPLPPAEIVREAMWMLLDAVEENPILKNTDNTTMATLQRKLPREIFESHTLDDAAFMQSLQQYGVGFKQPDLVIAKCAQALFGISHDFFKDEDYKQVINILLEGILHQVEEA